MENTVYDILIIGGGIAGAGIARDAALRGLKVLLLEKSTFGSGTSSKSSRLIHGGLRYLETAWEALKRFHFHECWKNIRFVFLALRETHILCRIAPKHIKPIPLLLPIYKNPHRNRWAVYFGTFIYGFFSKITGAPHWPRFFFSGEKLLKVIPSLNPNQLEGGVIIWDHVTQDQALTQAILSSAVKAGADAREHIQVTDYRRDSSGKFYEVSAKENGTPLFFIAKKLVNAAGPWVDQVRALSGDNKKELILPIAGAHITVPRFTEYSVILQADDGRLFFVINQGQSARVGTTERIDRDPDAVKATNHEITYLIHEIQKYFPQAGLREDQIISSDAGIRPLVKPVRDTPMHHVSREHAFATSHDGVIHVLGVKLTDHRRAAEELLNRIIKDFPDQGQASKTAHLPLENS